MTELLSGVEAPSDAELISRVRGGDVAAYGELFTRHVEAARRLGRQLVRGPDVDDLVSDAFAKTLTILQNGGGPDVAFRAYLLTSVRRLHVDKIRAAKKVQPADDMTVFDDGVPFQDTAVANFENGAAARAFSSLPERWQLVLWHLEVEGQKPADIAPLLGMSANSVSALAYRAREGLRQAFLTMHLADSPSDDCRWVNEHLGAYVRKGLSKRDTAKVDEHLEGCRRCTAMYLELSEVNSNLAGIIAPLLLGAAAAGYVSSAGGAGLTGVSALFGRVRDAVGGNSAGGTAAAGAGSAVTTGGLVTAGGVIAASVAAVTAAAFVFGGGPAKEVITEADQPVGIVQTPAAPGASGSSDSASDSGDRSAAEDAVAGDATDGSEEAIGDLPVSVSDGAGVEPEPAGTTDTPTDITSGDAPAAGPGTDAPGSDNGTVDGPGAAPGDAPGDGPATDEPGTDEPGTDQPGTEGPGTDQPGTEDPGTDGPGTEQPDNPGTDQPGTDQPGTDQPGTDEPGTDQPGDNNPGSGSDGGDDRPGDDDGLANTVLNVSALGIVDGTVAVAFDGADVDSSIELSVDSEQGGISISAGGDCLSTTDPDIWVCSPHASDVEATFVARVLNPAERSHGAEPYEIEVPLDVEAGRTLSGAALEYKLVGENAKPGREPLPVNAAIADLGLDLDAQDVTLYDDEPARYAIDSSLYVDPQSTETVVYTVIGEADWALEEMGCTPGADSSQAVCGAASQPRMVLAPHAPMSATPATVRVTPVTGVLDRDISNNSISFVLPALVSPAFGYVSTPSIVQDLENHTYEYSAEFEGVEEGDTVVLTLVGAPGQSHTFESSGTCSLGADNKTLSCQVPSGSNTLTVNFVVTLPGEGKIVSLVASLYEASLPPVALDDQKADAGPPAGSVQVRAAR